MATGNIGSAVGSALSKAISSTQPKVKDQSQYYNPNSPSTPLYVRGYTSISNGATTGKPHTKSSGSSSGGGETVVVQQGGGGGYDIAAALAAQRQAAINKAISIVDEAYNKKKELLGKNYNSSVSSLKNQYDYSSQDLQKDAAKSLKEAYINKMLSQKSIGQQLSALGIGGGAAESTIAGINNNYGNSRNNINTTLNDNIASLNNVLQNNLAAIEQSYNAALADAETARANAIAQISLDNLNADLSSLTSSSSDFARSIQDALANQASYQGTTTQANNGVSSVSTKQSNNSGNSTQYSRLAGLIDTAQRMADNNNDAEAITRALSRNYSVQPTDIQYILSQLS